MSLQELAPAYCQGFHQPLLRGVAGGPGVARSAGVHALLSSVRLVVSGAGVLWS